MEVTHQTIQDLKDEMVDMKAKLDELYFALIGNRVTMDGGLVRRVEDTEKEIRKLRDKIDALERINIKSALYVKILWACGGTIAGGAFYEILQLIFKK
jgi:hypothetical protein